jgi:hypothetical protein
MVAFGLLNEDEGAAVVARHLPGRQQLSPRTQASYRSASIAAMVVISFYCTETRLWANAVIGG